MFDFVPETADATQFVSILEKILSLMELWIARINGRSVESNDDGKVADASMQIRV